MKEVAAKNVWSPRPCKARGRSDEDSLRKCIRPLASGLHAVLGGAIGADLPGPQGQEGLSTAPPGQIQPGWEAVSS
jgi:hypothetical protein